VALKAVMSLSCRYSDALAPGTADVIAFKEIQASDTMRRLLPVYADDARSLLCLWLSATCWEIAAGALEGRPEGGVYAILGQRHTAQRAGLEHQATLEQAVQGFLTSLLPESRVRCTGQFP